MLAVNYSTLRDQLKEYCNRAADEGELVVITRKNEKNMVLMSLDQYNDLLKKIKNAEYLEEIDRRIEDLRQGKGHVHELIEVGEDGNEESVS